jgi:hypothetical protein
MRPIRRVRQEAVLDWVEMRLIHVSREVAIIADRVLRYRRCEMPRSPRLVMTGDRGSLMGNDFANAVSIAHHRPGKICIALWQGPQTVHVVGKDDPGVDMERCTGAHLPDRVVQRVDARHRQVRANVQRGSL